MAFLKNSMVAGDLRVTGTIFGDANLSSINANNTGLGTNGQILTSTGTGLAWSSSVTPASHTHGQITNDGKIASNTTVASADSFVYSDASDNNILKKDSAKNVANALINALDTGSSNLTANDYVITQYVGGGTTTTTYHRRPASALRVGGLLTARNLGVNLASTTAVTFDGTANQTNIPVSGTLPIANGGTGATDAATARTNLEITPANIGAATSGHTHDNYMVKGVDYVTAGKDSSITMGTRATAEGSGTKPTGNYSHAEGSSTTASGVTSHAEGSGTKASGYSSHAEGGGTTASGGQSHAEGGGTTASNENAHAEGGGTVASGTQSHAEGSSTIANHRSQHVFGEHNIADSSTAVASSRGNYVEIVGNGTSTSACSNARTLDWNGNEVLAGSLTVGAAQAVASNESVTLQYNSTTKSLDFIFA